MWITGLNLLSLDNWGRCSQDQGFLPLLRNPSQLDFSNHLKSFPILIVARTWWGFPLTCCFHLFCWFCVSQTALLNPFGNLSGNTCFSCVSFFCRCWRIGLGMSRTFFVGGKRFFLCKRALETFGCWISFRTFSFTLKPGKDKMLGIWAVHSAAVHTLIFSGPRA